MAEPTDLATAMDVCRPGSGDLQLPEMEPLRSAVAANAQVARRYEAIQRFDARLGDLIRQGGVPPELEDRILHALAAVDGSADADRARAVLPARLGRRRLWTVVAIAASLAAVATGVAVWSMLMGEDRLALTSIHEQAADWCDALDQKGWQETPSPQSFPFASEIRLLPNAWQRTTIPGAVGEAVAYRLPRPAGVRRMTLLVLRANVSRVPQIPPQNPYKTQDRLVAAWQVGENVFVLVIQGDDLGILQDTYQRYVKTSFPIT